MKTSRRVLAVVLPQLLCELAEAQMTQEQVAQKASGQRGAGPCLPNAAPLRASAPKGAWAVTLSDKVEKTSELQAKTLLDAANSEARKYGVKPGQSVAEARALVAKLRICELPKLHVRSALERICESVMRFGVTVAFEFPDTVWVDITGVAHLFGNEATLAEELAETVQAQGHAVRIAVASGPLLAQAVARWGSFPSKSRALFVSEEHVRQVIGLLPVVALPVSADVRSWLAQLGVLSFADLAKIPPAYATSRLGAGASEALALVHGQDDRPLNAYVPEVLPQEQTVWEEPASGVQPLLFALRGLSARLSERLEGRGLAAQSLRLTVMHDPAIARFRGCSAVLEQDYELSAPLFRSEEIWKVMSSRLSRTRLAAPSLGLKLQVRKLTQAHQRQLDLSSVHSKLDHGNPEALAVLFGELAADVGLKHFGVLRVCDSHRPEKASLLQSVNAKQFLNGSKQQKGKKPVQEAEESTQFPTEKGNFPSRLFTKPVLLNGPIRRGTWVPIGAQLFSIQRTKFEKRLHSVEWWSGAPVCRDYVRVWLENEQVAVEALVFVDRNTGQRFLQGVYD